MTFGDICNTGFMCLYSFKHYRSVVFHIKLIGNRLTIESSGCTKLQTVQALLLFHKVVVVVVVATHVLVYAWLQLMGECVSWRWMNLPWLMTLGVCIKNPVHAVTFPLVLLHIVDGYYKTRVCLRVISWGREWVKDSCMKVFLNMCAVGAHIQLY